MIKRESPTISNTVLTPTVTNLSLIELDLPVAALPAEKDFPQIEAELTLWLVALNAFLETGIAPFDESTQKVNRNWNGEVGITGWGLLKCSGLISTCRASTVASANELYTLQKMLHDSFALCEALSLGDKVDSATWTALRNNLLGEFEKCCAFALFRVNYKKWRADNALPSALEWIGQHPQLMGVLGADIQNIFALLNGMLERLQVIEQMLRRDQPLKPTLLLFALLKQETQNTIGAVNQVLLLLPNNSLLYEILDGFAYVIPMELRKVYEHELISVGERRQTLTLFAAVENAWGLLKDNFQQAIVALAGVFAPDLQSGEVFANQLTRREQSIILREQLWILLKFVQKVEKQLEPELLFDLNSRLSDFRKKTMLFLMFKDFETTERFIEELTRTKRPEEIAQVLHRFGAYLETLLSQINMRNVLADAPFDFSEVNFLKLSAKLADR